MKAKETLMYMIETLLFYLEELSEVQDSENEQFAYGEKTAYTECFEMLQLWEEAKEVGLDFNIEEQYPL